MTSMQNNNNKNDSSPTIVLYPPLDDYINNNSIHENDSSNSSASSSSPHVMSQQLEENFRVLKQSRKRQSEEDDDDSEMQQLAVETALLVQDQVKRMKSSIAELEGRLVLLRPEQEEREGHDEDDAALSSAEKVVANDGDKIRFPKLPRVVVIGSSPVPTDEDEDASQPVATPPPASNA